ncbi:MAG TPA: DUF2326 domain-containing protein [Pyrinomonadaceae bacterium]|nr:DUF2326 domain-containing protein [Pyrinomonadaceae bacterium]
MFLKRLKIENGSQIIRDISFYKGINLIVDETTTEDKKESGNSVGKTTVLRLIDFCLGGKGENIYQDTEFKKTKNTKVENFLKENDVTITLILNEDLEDDKSNKIVIKKNFLTYAKKVQEINGVSFSNDKEFSSKLKELIFDSDSNKPTFKQIVSKNIRAEKNSLQNTVKVLHPQTKPEEYEALYLFWLGINSDSSDRKQKLISRKRIEENLQKRLREDSNLSQVTQALLVVNRKINELEKTKTQFNLNENYNEDLSLLNQTKVSINTFSTEISRLEMRRELILESKTDLEKDIAEIDVTNVKKLYEEAKVLIPNLQKSFEETLEFHNQMVKEKVNYIIQELPSLESDLALSKRTFETLLLQEKTLTEKLKKTLTEKDFQAMILELNKSYERKGNLEKEKGFWETSNDKLQQIEKELKEIEEGITSNDELIQDRIAEFNKFFADISNRLYGEEFVLSPDRNDKGYELIITDLDGNIGTGKKKVQMAAFDLAYIQFADRLNIPCLHFVLQDQIENVHDNQITNLLTEIVSQINCQYITPVLRDKLPDNIDVEQYQILSLSQTDKLFRIE